MCFLVDLYYDENGQVTVNTNSCGGGDASFDTGEGAGNPGDFYGELCFADGFDIIHGGFNIVDYC